MLENIIIENYINEFKEFEPYHYYISQLCKGDVLEILNERILQYLYTRGLIDKDYLLNYLKQRINSLRIFYVGKIIHEILQEVVSGNNVKMEARVEIVFPSKEIPRYIKVSGRADLVDYDNEIVYEIKTVSDKNFVEISEPYIEHILQANAYAYLLGFKKYSIIYVSKGDYSMKEFKLNVNESLYERIVDTANKIAKIEYEIFKE